jgi:hypothetical protein
MIGCCSRKRLLPDSDAAIDPLLEIRPWRRDWLSFIRDNPGQEYIITPVIQKQLEATNPNMPPPEELMGEVFAGWAVQMNIPPPSKPANGLLEIGQMILLEGIERADASMHGDARQDPA